MRRQATHHEQHQQQLQHASFTPPCVSAASVCHRCCRDHHKRRACHQGMCCQHVKRRRTPPTWCTAVRLPVAIANTFPDPSSFAHHYTTPSPTQALCCCTSSLCCTRTQGIFRGYDQVTNVIMENCCELVFSTTVRGLGGGRSLHDKEAVCRDVWHDKKHTSSWNMVCTLCSCCRPCTA